MDASLVYDGKTLSVPASMGDPAPDQLQGTDLDRLGELASRICYDSLGFDENGKQRGRSSAKLHEHILQVKNHSVYEHANFTVRFDSNWIVPALLSCLNRKGVWVETCPDDDDVFEVTVNLRAVLEWDRHNCLANQNGVTSPRLKRTLQLYANRLAPQVVGPPDGSAHFLDGDLKTEGLNENQAWVTLWLYGSRGFTHEQVRHRFAMSQRSTRYVDEDGSPYIQHPLVTKYLNDPSVNLLSRQLASQLIKDSIEADRRTYRALVEDLQAYGLDQGLDKQTARKQARGASRGYLGNALASEMLFSAPVSGWKWILRQRANRLADAEIRTIYTPALAALKSSQYGSMFDEFELVPSPDGMGQVLRES